MAVSRYVRSPILAFGTKYGTSVTHVIIRDAIKNGKLAYQEHILRGRERLDTLAGTLYGDSRYWWVLAAASEIGWPLQVPPGTIIKAPVLKDVLRLVG